MLARLALAAFLGAAAAVAQTTWVVAPTSGPGVSFTSIQAAIDAAAHGDTVLVRAGAYREDVVVDKGLRLSADPGVQLTTLSTLQLGVERIPVDRTLTVRGMGFGQVGRISIRDCRGAVYFEDVTQPSTTVSNAFDIAHSDQVVLHNVTAVGFPALTTVDSRVVLSACTLRPAPFLTPTVALVVSGGRVSVVGGQVSGGSSPFAAGAPAIELRRGQLDLAGRSTRIAAGSGFAGATSPAISTLAGTIALDPAVTLAATGGSAPIAGPATVTAQPVPSVLATGFASGGTWQLDLHAPTGSAFCLFASAPLAAALATPYGEVWFDPAQHLVLACGSIGPGDRHAQSLPLPALPPGLALTAQAGVVVPRGIVTSLPAINLARR